MAIYTRFGNPFILKSPVDWNTGWCNGQVDYGDGSPMPREYHLTDLKADGGLNEIQAASDLLEWVERGCPCKDCGQPMEMATQAQRQGPPLTIVTCKNRECDLWSVTLTTNQYNGLLEADLGAYRTMVKGLKSSMEGK